MNLNNTHFKKVERLGLSPLKLKNFYVKNGDHTTWFFLEILNSPITVTSR